MTVKGSPFICILGAPKIGKTRLAATFNKPLFIDTESGAGSATEPERIMPVNGMVEGFLTDLGDKIKQIAKSPYNPQTRTLTYKMPDGKSLEVGTVVLDTIDGLQDPLKYAIMARFKHETMIDRDWGLLLDKLYPVFMSLTAIPVTKIVVSHTKTLDPTEENLGARSFSAQGALATKMPRWFDIMIHLITTDFKGTRVAYVQPSVVNRYQLMAGDRHNIFKKLGPSFPVPFDGEKPSSQIAELVQSTFDY